MGVKVEDKAPSGAPGGKTPRTARGERTLRKILDAAREEFGERGFSDSSIVGITQRAGVALGTFYTYFDSKEELFQALVRDMSAQVRDTVAPAFIHNAHALDAAREGLELFLKFAREHRDIILLSESDEEAGSTRSTAARACSHDARGVAGGSRDARRASTPDVHGGQASRPLGAPAPRERPCRRRARGRSAPRARSGALDALHRPRRRHS